MINWKTIGHGFVVPKYSDIENGYGVWDTVCLNFASGRYFETKEECQLKCNEMNGATEEV